MGALSVGLPFPVDVWRQIIAKRVPAKTVDGNLAAFERGRKACADGECEA